MRVRWRPAPGGWSDRRWLPLFEVFENVPDDGGILDAGDDAHVTAAAVTGLDVDVKHPFQALGLRLMAACRSSADRVFRVARPDPRPAGVTRARCLLWGANTPWKRVRLTRGWGAPAPPAALLRL